MPSTSQQLIFSYLQFLTVTTTRQNFPTSPTHSEVSGIAFAVTVKLSVIQSIVQFLRPSPPDRQFSLACPSLTRIQGQILRLVNDIKDDE